MIRESDGQAFPWESYSRQGMTLRDWFAGQYISGVLADPNFNEGCERTAELAYQQADAMLEARKK